MGIEGSPQLCSNSYFLGNDGSVGRRVLGRTSGLGNRRVENDHGHGWDVHMSDGSMTGGGLGGDVLAYTVPIDGGL